MHLSVVRPYSAGAGQWEGRGGEGREWVQWRLLQRGETRPELGHSVSLCYGIYLMSLFKLFICLFLALLSLCCCSGFSLVVMGNTLQLQCAAFSLQCLLLLQCMGSRPVGFSSAVHGLQTSVAVAFGLCCSTVCGIFPDQGSNPVSPALAGGFFTTEPPGKPPIMFLNGPCQSLRDSHLHSYLPQQKLGGATSLDQTQRFLTFL